ncbi:MAG TPA: Rv2231c family pyridoxal phosphate-dependent protein CobC [Jatrophihabitans sp.]|nr:Rv2231c family pyridoxal phosphate-dependent protein CobC [Jatrophihabitans sp.]
MTDLHHHGDADVLPGLVDLAVNVRPGTPPRWLLDRLATVDLSRYPNQDAAMKAVATRHQRSPGEVLLTAGAAEAFVLLARALRPRHPVVIHPQFTAPEAALRAAGHDVHRVVLAPPFTLDTRLVPPEADLVVIGNPTNPTSVLHHRDAVRALVRPHRLVVVDEAFADCDPDEAHSLANDQGVVVVRSLTKTWGLAGLRVGYVLAGVAVLERLRAAQPHWPVSAPALEALLACSTPAALAESRAWAAELATTRTRLAGLLQSLPGVAVVPNPRASFLLVRTPVPQLWNPLRDKGFAVRRGETFPGLGPTWIRVAVRDEQTSTSFVQALQEVLDDFAGPR